MSALKSGTQELIKRGPELSKDPTKYFINYGIDRLLKGTATQITSQKGGFLNLRPLVTTGLPLMKNVLAPLGTSVLMSLGL